MKKASSDTAQRRPSQTGSTLLGIIIGLIVGLAIAVVVALVITKGNSPFTNKLGKQERASESASAPLADPNKPLYGNRDAAKEAAKEFAQESSPGGSPAPTASPAPAATTATAATDPNKSKPTPAATPSPSPLAAASPAPQAAASPTPAANPEEKWIYYLQAGAFRDQADAEKTRANLALLGFEAAISERNSDNGVLYRVRLGPFNQVEGMNRARAKLSEHGVDVSVVRNQK